MKKLTLEKGDTKKLLIFLGVILFLVLGSISRIKHLSDPDAGTSDHKVLYVISSDSILDANLTYINSSGGSEQEHFNGRDHSFAKEYEMVVTKASGDPVYISAQLNDEFAYKVHVEILVDGKLMQEASSTGTYSIATASGSIP